MENLKSEFLSPLYVRSFLPSVRRGWWAKFKISVFGENPFWVLTEDLSYRSAFLGETIVVPKGFVTDFASVPRLPIVFWLTGDCAHDAAVVHDYLYQTHLSETRARADRTFLEAMKITGVPAWRRLDMYLGVRAGGISSWSSGPRRFKIFGNSTKNDQ